MSTLHTPLCDLLGIDVPILQAGMGRSGGSPTTVDLVVACSEAGGLGCLGATGMDPEDIRAAIRAIRARTNRPFAVDLLLPVSLASADVPREEVRREIQRSYPEHWQFRQELLQRFGLDPDARHPAEWALSPTLMRAQADVVLGEAAPILISALGDPRWIVPRAREAGVLVAGLVCSVRHAERQKEAGVDFIIAQGSEAGGHVGNVATFALVPQVVDRAGSTPVVAAGGIGDGRGIAAALALGAQGAWCGTAFLFSHEYDMYDVQREQLAAADSEQLVVGRSFTGKPTRIVDSDVVRAWKESPLEPLPMPLQMVLMDDFVYAAGVGGKPELINNPGGQIAGMLHDREPAATILRRMADEAATCIAGLQGCLR